ncbi:MAG: hypothetical protein GF309_06805 [Candidatus Lokiarchaeota archaeon]|nr:hypothetical protein [Candidatus Lokiarchaeota archaeon]
MINKLAYGTFGVPLLFETIEEELRSDPELLEGWNVAWEAFMDGNLSTAANNHPTIWPFPWVDKDTNIAQAFEDAGAQCVFSWDNHRPAAMSRQLGPWLSTPLIVFAILGSTCTLYRCDLSICYDYRLYSVLFLTFIIEYRHETCYYDNLSFVPLPVFCGAILRAFS